MDGKARSHSGVKEHHAEHESDFLSYGFNKSPACIAFAERVREIRSLARTNALHYVRVRTQMNPYTQESRGAESTYTHKL